MQREDLSDLFAFRQVARERSFTRAAAVLGTSQSALSHLVRRLESRLGVRLLTRSTRSVSLTEAGEKLLGVIDPAMADIDAGLNALSEWRDKPAGTVRITASELPAETILWPALSPLLKAYPDIHVEIDVNDTLKDIVAHRYDAGVRFGDQVAQDMVSVRIGPDSRFVVIGAPTYFAAHGIPEAPQDLGRHQCINLRLPTFGNLYAWEMERDGRAINMRVEGRLVFNKLSLAIDAALDGFGLAFVPLDLVETHIAEGRLETALDAWNPPFTGYHLYYPSRRQQSPAFALVVQALRYPRSGKVPEWPL
ncbi:MAG: LysR family transcriptional regulator [Pseudomonadota bacterium]